MKNLKPFLILSFIGILFLQSCKTTAEVPTGNSLVDFEVLAEGFLYINETEDFSQEIKVVRSELELLALLEKMNRDNETVEKPSVNFENTMLLFCFDRVRGTSGHSIEVKLINETEDQISVHLTHTGPKDMAAEVITQPFTIVSIDKTDKKIQMSFTE